MKEITYRATTVNATGTRAVIEMTAVSESQAKEKIQTKYGKTVEIEKIEEVQEINS